MLGESIVKEISIPDYITSLPQEEIDDISSRKDADMLVIACGVHPKDQSLMMITGGAQVFSIVPNGKMVPKFAEPVSGGEYVRVMFHPPYGLHMFNSRSALSAARNETDDAQLQVNGVALGNLTSGSDG